MKDQMTKEQRMTPKKSPSRFLTNLSDAVRMNKGTKEYKKGIKKALDKAKK